jgi:hypothetical protein
MSHFFDGLIADQQRFAVRRDVEEGVAVDFALDWVDLRALELQAGQQRKHRQCGVGDGHFTRERVMMGEKEWEVFFEGGRPILNDLVWPQATA